MPVLELWCRASLALLAAIGRLRYGSLARILCTRTRRFAYCFAHFHTAAGHHLFVRWGMRHSNVLPTPWLLAAVAEATWSVALFTGRYARSRHARGMFRLRLFEAPQSVVKDAMLCALHRGAIFYCLLWTSATGLASMLVMSALVSAARRIGRPKTIAAKVLSSIVLSSALCPILLIFASPEPPFPPRGVMSGMAVVVSFLAMDRRTRRGAHSLNLQHLLATHGPRSSLKTPKLHSPAEETSFLASGALFAVALIAREPVIVRNHSIPVHGITMVSGIFIISTILSLISRDAGSFSPDRLHPPTCAVHSHDVATRPELRLATLPFWFADRTRVVVTAIFELAHSPHGFGSRSPGPWFYVALFVSLIPLIIEVGLRLLRRRRAGQRPADRLNPVVNSNGRLLQGARSIIDPALAFPATCRRCYGRVVIAFFVTFAAIVASARGLVGVSGSVGETGWRAMATEVALSLSVMPRREMWLADEIPSHNARMLFGDGSEQPLSIASAAVPHSAESVSFEPVARWIREQESDLCRRVRGGGPGGRDALSALERDLLRGGKHEGSAQWRSWASKRWRSEYAKWHVTRLNQSPKEQQLQSFEHTLCGIREVNAMVLPDGTELKSDPSAPSNTVAVLFQQDPESNVGHALREGAYFCAYLFAARIAGRRIPKSPGLPLAPKLTFLVHMPSAYPHGRAGSGQGLGRNDHQWRYFYAWKVAYLQALSGRVVQVGPHNTDYHEIGKFSRLFIAPWEGKNLHQNPLCGSPINGVWGRGNCEIEMKWIEVDKATVPLYRDLSSTVRSFFRNSIHPSDDVDNLPTPPVVLFFQRQRRRRVVDIMTGEATAVVSALCARGLPVQLTEFSPATGVLMRDQIRLLDRTAVMLTSHGSNQFNAVWMRPGTVQVEVTLRRGWCCKHTEAKHLYDKTENPHAPPCIGPCSPFVLNDVVNFLGAFGVLWAYYVSDRERAAMHDLLQSDVAPNFARTPSTQTSPRETEDSRTLGRCKKYTFIATTSRTLSQRHMHTHTERRSHMSIAIDDSSNSCSDSFKIFKI